MKLLMVLVMSLGLVVSVVASDDNTIQKCTDDEKTECLKSEAPPCNECICREEEVLKRDMPECRGKFDRDCVDKCIQKKSVTGARNDIKNCESVANGSAQEKLNKEKPNTEGKGVSPE
jgi:hypothetical protein